MLRRAFAGLLAVVVLVAGAPDARAESPVFCGSSMTWDGQKCQVIASSPGRSGGTTANGSAAGTVSRAQPRTCSYAGLPMPCQDPQLGWWSDAKNCYVQLASPQPPVTAAAWDGHTDGAIYNCALPGRNALGGMLYMFWSATAPVGPDPAVLAQQAVASMRLRPIAIGIVPEDTPGSVGLVGMPVWLWAENPDQQSWGPITRTASAGGASVTATATVQKVRWLMGDGAVVVCSGPGTVYEDRFGNTDSPTCGHTYPRQGTYTVRAESQWRVVWSGMGQSGTIPVTLTGDTTITIGELQVLTTG